MQISSHESQSIRNQTRNRRCEETNVESSGCNPAETSLQKGTPNHWVSHKAHLLVASETNLVMVSWMSPTCRAPSQTLSCWSLRLAQQLRCNHFHFTEVSIHTCLTPKPMLSSLCPQAASQTSKVSKWPEYFGLKSRFWWGDYWICVCTEWVSQKESHSENLEYRHGSSLI